jgi:hypothetical protein
VAGEKVSLGDIKDAVDTGVDIWLQFRGDAALALATNQEVNKAYRRRRRVVSPIRNIFQALRAFRFRVPFLQS